MLDNFSKKLLSELPWTNTYGVARSLMALSTGLLLLINPSYFLFNLIPGGSFERICKVTGHSLNFFCIFPEYLNFVKIVAGIILLIIATGIYPRFTGVIHWWITLSFLCSAEVVNGGDQLAAVLTFFMLPITLTDPRQWHWQVLDSNFIPTPSRALMGWWSLWVIRIQVCLVYFHAAAGKLRVNEWIDGSALYYFFNHPVFGVPENYKPYINPILYHGPLIALMAWSVLAVEFFIAANLFSKPVFKPWALGLGIFFHTMTIFIHGLPSFALVMYAALILFLVPIHSPRLTKILLLITRRTTGSREISRSRSPLAARLIQDRHFTSV